MSQTDPELLKKGFFAKKQMFCRDPLIKWSHNSRFETARRLLKTHAGKYLLDYGSGDGTFLALVHDLFPRATGVDRSPQAVLDCRQRLNSLDGLSFVVTSDLSDPQFSGACDVITCMEVLEHCVQEDQEEVLRNIWRLCKPSGMVLISVPVEIGPSLIIKYFVRWLAGLRKLGDYSYYERHTLGELKTLSFADENTRFERPTFYRVPNTREQPFYGHKGFNWKVLRSRLAEQYVIEETHFSPVDWLGEYCSSQVWFVLHKREL